MPKILYFPEMVTALKTIPTEVRGTLEKIRHGDYRSVIFKKIGNKLYSARVNRPRAADRLLFTINESKQLVLLEVVNNHDYQKAKFMNPTALKGYRRHQDNEEWVIQECDVDEAEMAEVMPASTEEQVDYQAVIQTPNGVVELSLEQQNLFGVRSFIQAPATVEGKAGTGKTTSATGILQQLVLQSTGRILYLADAPVFLAGTRDFFLTEVCPEAAGRVDFFTYQNLVEQHQLNLVVVSADRFKTYLEEKHAKLLSPSRPVAFWLDECRYLSGLTLAVYLETGRKTSLLEDDKAAKQGLWDVFQGYRASLVKSGEIDLSLSAVPPVATPPYEWVLVDEGHLLSATQIKYLLSLVEKEQFIFFADSGQRTRDRRFEQLGFLKSLLSQSMTSYDLTSSFRCPEAVQAFVGIWQDMKYQLNPRSPEKRRANPSQNALSMGSVQVLEKEEKDLIAPLTQSTSFALITHQSKVDALKEQYGTPLVFSPESRIGLEFDVVFVIDVLSAEVLRAVAGVLNGPGTKKMRLDESNCDELSSALTDLHIACTRARKHLIFYQTDLNKRYPVIWERIKAYRQGHDNTHIEQLKPSTEAEWAGVRAVLEADQTPRTSPVFFKERASPPPSVPDQPALAIVSPIVKQPLEKKQDWYEGLYERLEKGCTPHHFRCIFDRIKEDNLSASDVMDGIVSFLERLFLKGQSTNRLIVCLVDKNNSDLFRYWSGLISMYFAQTRYDSISQMELEQKYMGIAQFILFIRRRDPEKGNYFINKVSQSQTGACVMIRSLDLNLSFDTNLSRENLIRSEYDTLTYSNKTEGGQCTWYHFLRYSVEVSHLGNFLFRVLCSDSIPSIDSSLLLAMGADGESILSLMFKHDHYARAIVVYMKRLNLTLADMVNNDISLVKGAEENSSIPIFNYICWSLCNSKSAAWRIIFNHFVANKDGLVEALFDKYDVVINGVSVPSSAFTDLVTSVDGRKALTLVPGALVLKETVCPQFFDPALLSRHVSGLIQSYSDAPWLCILFMNIPSVLEVMYDAFLSSLSEEKMAKNTICLFLLDEGAIFFWRLLYSHKEDSKVLTLLDGLLKKAALGSQVPPMFGNAVKKIKEALLTPTEVPMEATMLRLGS